MATKKQIKMVRQAMKGQKTEQQLPCTICDSDQVFIINIDKNTMTCKTCNESEVILDSFYEPLIKDLRKMGVQI